jgi:hypothetical protein
MFQRFKAPCWVPWDDAIRVSAGKLRKLWDSLSELRSFLCERRLERTVLRSALLPVKTEQVTQFFRHVWRHTVKPLSLTESVNGALKYIACLVRIKPRYKPAFIPVNVIIYAVCVNKPSCYTLNMYITFSPTPSTSKRFNSPSQIWSQRTRTAS